MAVKESLRIGMPDMFSPIGEDEMLEVNVSFGANRGVLNEFCQVLYDGIYDISPNVFIIQSSLIASPMLLEGHNLAFGLCPQSLDQFRQVVHRLVMGGFVPLQVSHGDVHGTMPEQMGDGA